MSSQMNYPQRQEIYRKQLVAAMPRVLSELDRDPLSFTYGSFDREYWAWATKDFSNVDLHRFILPLSWMYTTKFEGNIWFESEAVFEWINAAMGFWSRSRRANGSHDHHYPWESSFVGEAFPLFETTQAFRMLDSNNLLTDDNRLFWLGEMVKSADFLCISEELHGFISNHRLGAASALHEMSELCGETKYLRRSQSIVDSVIEKQNKNEGWLYEYGGADPGYQTLGTHFAANYYRVSENEEFLERVIRPSVKFLSHFVHPDGSVGGEYGSRNCPLFYPGGFEMLAHLVPEAEMITSVTVPHFLSYGSPTLMAMDIRNLAPMMSSYTQAAGMNISLERQSSRPPYDEQFERYWPEAGVFVRSDKSHYVVAGLSKGGVVKVFDKASQRLTATHCGYVLSKTNGIIVSNQFHAQPVEVQGLDDCREKFVSPLDRRVIEFTARCYVMSHDRTMSPLKLLLFRIFSMTVGRNMFLADWFKRNIITGLFIHRRKSTNEKIRRSIDMSSDGVALHDEFKGLGHSIRKNSAAEFFTTIYMASSKYFRFHEQKKPVMKDVQLPTTDGSVAWKMTEEGFEYVDH